MRTALLILHGWGGRLDQKVEIVGETPRRYRIRAITRTRLAGKYRYIEPGQTALVPRGAVWLQDGP